LRGLLLLRNTVTPAPEEAHREPDRAER